MASKTQRREAGSGSIYQRHDHPSCPAAIERVGEDGKAVKVRPAHKCEGLWVTSIELPDVNNKRRRKVIARALKADVVTAKRAAEKELLRTGDLVTSSMTTAAWMARYLEKIAKPKLKPRTFETYAFYVRRYIVPSIGKVRLDKLTPDHVTRLHDYVLAGIAGKPGLSTTTALQAHAILSRALVYALREGRVSRNVATLVDRPSKALNVEPALDADQARALLLSVAGDDQEAAMWSVALLTGLRRGEQLGLTEEGLCLDAVSVAPDGTITPTPYISVIWQIQQLSWLHGCAEEDGKPTCGHKRGGNCPDRHIDIPADQEAHEVYGGLWMTRPKSKKGWRQIPLAPLLAEVLTRYVKTHPAGDRGLIFTRPGGHPISPPDHTAAWDAALRRAGLPDVVLHSARHTAATLLHKLGVDPQTRQDILGHSTATTTAGYTHIATEITRDAMGQLGALLAPQIEG